MAKTDWLEDKNNLILLEGWARDGLTNEQIAHNIGIGERTLYEWINKFPQVSQALKKGKEVIDYIIENDLFKKAHEEKNLLAMIFWLKNRRPDKWRDKPVEKIDLEDIPIIIDNIPPPENKDE